jgi:hypothetical protein
MNLSEAFPAKVHDFHDSLELSHAYENAPWWDEIYRQAFPGLRSSVSVRRDGWAQRAGIDRVLTLASGKVVKVDEKVRGKAWPDILLERWSDEARGIAGWIQKTLDCDYIAYAFIPTATCYLLPFLTLRRAWLENGRQWIEQYQPPIRAHNKGWVTVSVAVPIDVLMAAMNDAMRITWVMS